MKLGISIELYKMGDLDEKLRAAAACGFEYCQLFLREVEVTEEAVSEAAKLCKSYGIKVGPVGTYANPLRPGESPMGWNMDKVRRMIALLPILETNEIVIWSGTSSKELLAYEVGNFADASMRKVVATADELLGLLSEIRGTVTFEPYYTHVLHGIPSIRAFKRSVKSDRVKVVVDPPNYISPKEFENRDARMVELVESLHDDIGAVHFKDFKLLPDGTWDYPGPGGGVMNYSLLMKKLKETGYSSWGIIEHVQPPEFAAAKAFVESKLKAAEAGQL